MEVTADTFFDRVKSYAEMRGYAKDGYPVLNVAESGDKDAWLHWMCYFASLKMRACFNIMAKSWQERHGKMTVPSRYPEDFDATRTIQPHHVEQLVDRLEGIGEHGAIFPDGPWRREFAKRIARFDIPGSQELIDAYRAGATEPEVKEYPRGWVGLKPATPQPAGRFVSETDSEWIRKRNAQRSAKREARSDALSETINNMAAKAIMRGAAE